MYATVTTEFIPERIVYRPDEIDTAILRTGGIGDCVWLLPTVRALARKGRTISVHVRRATAPVFLHNPYIAAINMYDNFEDPLNTHMKFVVEDSAGILWLDKYIETFLEFDDIKKNLGCEIHRHFTVDCAECLSGKLRRMERIHGQNFPELYLNVTGCPDEDPSYLNELYFTEEEHRALKVITADWEGHYVVLWLLGHQNYHTYLRFPEVIQEFTDKYADAIVYITGYEYLIKNIGSDNPNIRIGNWPLRQTLGLLGYADLIVGSATGIMNAAGAFGTPKICMLSTVFPEQFGKHWKNTTWIYPEVPCAPCNQGHTDKNTCPTIDGWSVCTAGRRNAELLKCMESAKEIYD